MRPALALVILGLLSAGAAQAQVATKAPTDITADELEVLKAQCTSIFRGDAEALQGNAKLRAKMITAFATPRRDGCGETERIEAVGDVYYVTDVQVVRGDRAVFALATSTIVVTGDVIVIDGKNIARGDALTVNTKTGSLNMQSKATGRASKQRVRGVFYSESSAKTGQ